MTKSAIANIENEGLLLSALMERPGAVDEVCDIVDTADFAEPAHQVIFDTILSESAQGRPTTVIALGGILRDHPVLEPLKGRSYLASLLSYGASSLVDIRYAANNVADLAARRRLVDDLAAARDRAGDLSRTLAEVVDESDAALVAAVDRRHSLQQASLADSIDRAMARIQAIQANEGKVGATTGIDELDELLGGFEPGQLVVVAARPAMGKTAVACSAALGLARQGHGVLFASLEMNATELGMRMVSDLCCIEQRGAIPFDAIVRATVNSRQADRMIEARDAIQNWPLRIIDAGSISLARLQLGTRRVKRRMAAKGQTLKVVVVDYLQLVQPDAKGMSAYEAVSQVSRGLKAMAKDLGVTVVALAQLSRAVEQREDKRPMLSDLRDSGQIEQDADAVVFLYRGEYYLERVTVKKGQEAEHAASLEESRGKLALICAKRRNGRTGAATCQYLTNYQAVRSAHWGPL